MEVVSANLLFLTSLVAAFVASPQQNIGLVADGIWAGVAFISKRSSYAPMLRINGKWVLCLYDSSPSMLILDPIYISHHAFLVPALPG